MDNSASIALYESNGFLFELYDGGQPYQPTVIRWERLQPVIRKDAIETDEKEWSRKILRTDQMKMTDFLNTLRECFHQELAAKTGWGREELKALLNEPSLMLSPQEPTSSEFGEETAMSLKIRFRFDGRCRMHPRYNPERDGSPEHKDCSGCESLRAIQLYVSIAQKKAKAGEGLIVSFPDPLASAESDPAAQSSEPDVEQLGQPENSAAPNSD